MFKNILVAIYRTPEPKEVLELVVKTASASTRVQLICVIPVEFFAPDDESKEASPASGLEQLRSENFVKDAQDYLRDRGIESTGAVIAGDPELAISNYARDFGNDLIVMGHHHMSIMQRLVGDSIAYKVLQNSPCPVLVGVEAIFS